MAAPLCGSSFAQTARRQCLHHLKQHLSIWPWRCQRPTYCASAQSRAGSASDIKHSAELIDVNPVRGTRDFAPEEYRIRRWLFDEFEAVSRLFGFEQFETPMLESEDLFVRKAGEEITQQLYNFEDKGQRRVALRPELTPSLARLILRKGKALPMPVKWFTVGQCWRYERTTRGRRREHFQWNMDVVGVPGVEAEVELLTAIAMLLQRLGLGPADVAIKVSSRKVLQALLAKYQVPEASFGPVCIVVDKLDKLPAAQVREELGQLQVSPEAIDGILRLTELTSLEEVTALLGSDNEALAELSRLFELAEASGISEFLEFDPSIVRGLAYYTGIVFEGQDRGQQFRALFGGGRYDGLLGTFGGEAQPCAGFGFGDCVILELLQDRGLVPAMPRQVDDFVVAMDASLHGAASSVAQRLRAHGRTVDLALESRKMKWVFKQSERVGAKRLVLVAPDEWAQGKVRVKDLAAREEKDVSLDDLTA
ncbi:hypothetical protein WJX73_004804 [Symbiochloris irregularis]|uniref:histidine--tRNA ligase n=1 Tax=Symbiochloris irregularis TaxID=706552 RepID=A0AAW1P3X0_9CHLO